MPADDAILLLRAHDPARRLEPLTRQAREAQREAVLASAPPALPARRLRGGRSRTPKLLAAVVAALAVGVGAAWAAGALSPLALFQQSLQQKDAAPGSLWDQRVIPASVLEAATVDIPKVGAVGFWYGRSREGGWCGALRLPSGAWVGTGTDGRDAGGAVPGCFPTRSAVNRSSKTPVYVVDGFDYEEGDVDARDDGGTFWRIRYGRITIPGAARVADLVSGRSAPVVHGDLFALAIPDGHPESALEVHLVAYGAGGEIVGDNCPACPAP